MLRDLRRALRKQDWLWAGFVGALKATASLGKPMGR